MATYAIGDIQGCYHAFQALLNKINFKPQRDHLWLVGDIINRGSGSLAVLRWCYAHQDSIKMVLGNHDLHAIVVAHGIKKPHRSDTLQAIFDANDSTTLLTWLRHQPLLVSNETYLMVHAGLLPEWTVEEARRLAKEVEAALQSPNYVDFLRKMYGNKPKRWQNNLTGYDRLRVITNAFTRMRTCTVEGNLDFDFKGQLKDMPKGLLPWFAAPSRASQQQKIVCGHWSALGLYQQHNVYALDTGCLWGGVLTAMCLETNTITQVPSHQQDKPLKL